MLGQLFASVALNRLSASDPYDFRTPIYTQVIPTQQRESFIKRESNSIFSSGQ